MANDSPLTLTIFEDALKEWYEPMFERNLREQTIFFDERIIARDREHVEGKYAYVGVEWLTLNGIGARGEYEEGPAAKPGDYARLQIPMRYNYAKVLITGQTIEASRSNRGAFIPGLDAEVTGKIRAQHMDLNRQFLMDGSGVLAMVDDASPDTTLEVDNAGGFASNYNGHRYITKGSRLDIYSAKTGGTYRGSCEVLSVTKGSTGSTTTASLTLDSLPTGTANNDYIFREGSRGKECMGIYGLIDTNQVLTTLQGLTISSYPDFQSQRKTGSTAGTNEALSIERMMDLWNDIVYEGDGKTDFIIGQPKMQMAYQQVCAAQGFKTDMKTLEGGWEGPEFMGVPVIAEPYTPPNRLYYIDTSTIKVYQMTDGPQWLDRGTGIMKQVTTGEGYDAFYMQRYWYCELGISNRMKNGVLEDIEEVVA